MNARRTGGATAFGSTSSGPPATTSTCCRTIGSAKHSVSATIRDGLRWHLIEKSPGKYDWSSWLPALEAAERIGLQIIWDLFHYGSPDHVDQAADDFPERFTDFALAAMEVQQSVSGRAPLVCPMNEINFLSWAVDDGYFPHVGPDQRGWFKRQLVRTAIMAARAIKQRWPDTTIVWAEPLIHIAPHDRRRRTVRAAEQNLQGMFEAYDWIMGLAEPELGGDRSLVDVVGWNFYPHNQWYYEGPTIPMGHHEYRPLADMLVEMAERYRKPIFLSETGAEGSAKPSWLHYVCNEVRDAMGRGADIRGSAGIRSPLTPAGTIHGTPRPDCFRRSWRTAAATSMSRCSRSSRCSASYSKLRLAFVGRRRPPD